MHITIISITLILLTGYILLFIYSNIGWKKVSNQERVQTNSKTFISIIIPFRNELKNLDNLLNSLNDQDYSKDNFEVIMIDDHSDDGSWDYLEKKQSQLPFKLILHRLSENKTFKKIAIEEGVSRASGKLIVTSDADTIRNVKWLSQIASFYDKYKSALIILPVMLNSGTSFIERFQQIEFLSLQWITASFSGNNNSILCNGANLAFEKEIFEKVGGYKQNRDVASGDDFFLLMKVKKQFKNRISFLYSEDAVVFSNPQSTLKEFFQQRIRWAGKTKYANDLSIYITGMFNVFFSFWLVILPFIEYDSSSFPIYSVLIWLVKIIGDYSMLHKTASFYKTKFKIKDFFYSILYYPFYICSIFILSLILKPKWKGREI